MTNSSKVADTTAAGPATSRLWAGLACLCLALALSACAIPAQAVSEALPSQAQAQSLLIQGYNYTDTYIDSFTVNGAGGGNIFVSSPTTGGGKSTCCYSFNPASKAQVTIRWSANYCMYSTTNKYGETYQWRKSLFREVQVPIERPQAGVPAALEVHFYPDGHVEAAVTPGYSPPRLKLPITADEQRPGASSNFPPCSHDQIQQAR
jgi:hypothetical protein